MAALTQAFAAYDEDADGFTFRKRAKAAPKAKQPPEKAPVVDEQAQDDAPKPARGKRVSIETGASASDAAPTRRRSARLSGENAQVSSQRAEDSAQRKRRSRSQTSQEPQRKTPAPADGPLHVEKKRDTKIALPFADTPIINRNREMRDASNSSRRRSSSGMRGRRASSLMNSGTSSGKQKHTPLEHGTLHELHALVRQVREKYRRQYECTNVYTPPAALPHSEVQTNEFYKHIDQSLLEPARMRQLLVWCGTRALSDLPKSRASGHFNAVRAARTIQEELLRDFTSRSEMSDWFSRPEHENGSTLSAEALALVKKPNPRNLQNAAKLAELEQQVARLEKEKEQWSSLLGGLKTSLQEQRQAAEARDGQSSQDYDSAVAGIDPKRLESMEQTACLELAASYAPGYNGTKARVQQVCNSVEFAVDNLAQGVHEAQQFQSIVDKAADRLLADTAQALERRDKEALERRGMEKVGVGDILRGISRAA